MDDKLIIQILENIGRGKAESLSSYLKTVESDVSLQETRTKFYAHTISLNANEQVRLDDFIEFIAHHIIAYVIPRSRIEEAEQKDKEEGLHTHIMRLSSDARKLFTPLKKTGEGGEMLLFVLGEVLLGLPQLFCKMSVKTSGGVHYHGADGIHVGFGDDKNLELYWGESKFHKTFDSALKDCLSSISPILNRENDADHEDLLLLQTHLDLKNPDHTKAIKFILDKNNAEFNKVKYCGICLIGFNETVYTKGITEEQIKTLCSSWKGEISKAIKGKKLDEFDIHFFCLPVVCVDEFRKKFLEKMGISSNAPSEQKKSKVKKAPKKEGASK